MTEKKKLGRPPLPPGKRRDRAILLHGSLYDRVKERAERNQRSMTTEVIVLLELAFDRGLG